MSAGALIRRRRLSGAIVLAVLAAAAMSCGGSAASTRSSGLEPTATATFRWTVEESSDATFCAHYGASSVNIDLYERNGAYVDRVTKPCSEFVATASLREGGYSAALQLVDASGAAVSLSLASSFDVPTTGDTVVDTDFAKMSFP
ncbi:MAG TPA: hypothetical protein VKU41_21180 [Polyangiaceae bacterium]|nr:hypothetical protein [Polyangiaceae bacterium]